MEGKNLSAPSPQGSPALCVAKGRGPTGGTQHALLLVLQKCGKCCVTTDADLCKHVANVLCVNRARLSTMLD